MSGPDDEFLDELIAYVAKGLVVPIVGQDLLVWERGVEREMLYPLLAKRLAGTLGVTGGDAADGMVLETVYRAWKERETGRLSGGRSSLYWRIHRAWGELEKEVQPPRALRQLAAIRGFRTIVTTTFDTLLERAMREERKGEVRVLKFSPGNHPKLPVDLDLDRGGTSLLIHLFGQVSESPDYAATEGDLLEFAHALQSEALLPSGLMSVFEGRHLLFLGNSFPDWLERFFVRTTKAARLGVEREGGRREIVADAEVRRNPRLARFFTQFPDAMDVITSMDAGEFVDRLHRRIEERHPEMLREEVMEAAAELPGSREVFLSYATADQEAVLEIKRRLEARHLTVWCDTKEIEPGANLRDRIRRAIEGCYAFVPVLSESTEARPKSWFREEWKLAKLERLRLAENLNYFFPVFLDPGVREAGLWIPPEFRTEVLAVEAPRGEVPTAFVDSVMKLVRERKQLELGRR